MLKMLMLGVLALVAALVLSAKNAHAQDALPSSWHLDGITHIYQGWNNCGPATLTMGLTYFGHDADQYPAAQWLKPNSEDKNVSPWQMMEYVNSQTGGTVYALERQGGTLERLKALIASNFVVIIEEGYEPPGENLGWMGHYLLVSGYDDATQQFTTQDSYKGANILYSYDHISEYWSHFNNLYLVLYDISREAELMTLLGTDADERQNYQNALVQATEAARADQTDAFAWFNIGTNYVGLGDYERAAAAFDQARNAGLPWRMMWYQFGAFEAYQQVGRFQDMIDLAAANLSDGGGQFVEETFYYGALAREGLGERSRAIDNLNGALAFNPNFTPARIVRDQLLAQSG